MSRHSTHSDPGPNGTTPVLYLVVVRRGKSVLFKSLTDRREELDLAELIWDRRVGERRISRQSIATERRRGDRRQPPPETWDALGFVLVPRPRATPRA